MRPRLNTTSVPRQRLGKHVPRLGGGQVALGDDDDEGQLLAQRERGVHRAAVHHGGGDQAPEHAGRRVLGMPVVGGGHRERVLGTRRRRRRRRRARRRNPGRGRPGSASAPSRRSGRGPRTSAHDPGRQVRGVVEEAGALALGVHAQRRRLLDLDADVAGRAPRPACRSPARGWPTTQGPGRARRQARRSEQALEKRLGRDVLVEPDRHRRPLGAEGDDDRSRPCVPRRACSATWRAGTKTPRGG